MKGLGLRDSRDFGIWGFRFGALLYGCRVNEKVSVCQLDGLGASANGFVVKGVA